MYTLQADLERQVGRLRKVQAQTAAPRPAQTTLLALQKHGRLALMHSSHCWQRSFWV